MISICTNVVVMVFLFLDGGHRLHPTHNDNARNVNILRCALLKFYQATVKFRTGLQCILNFRIS